MIFYNKYVIIFVSLTSRMKSKEEGFYPRKKVIIMSCKKTSKGVASKDSKALRDGRTSKTTKSIAGSALLQRQPNHTHKKK